MLYLDMSGQHVECGTRRLTFQRCTACRKPQTAISITGGRKRVRHLPRHGIELANRLLARTLDN